MSATVSHDSLERLAGWLGARLFVTNFRPVPLFEHVVVDGYVNVKRMEDAENKKKAAAAAAAAAATATASKVAAGSGGGEGGGGHWTSGEYSGRGRNENHAPWNGVGQLG
eukprot:CAMPEP_0181381182 /NCGR_PEP_ID=MMETSP1106-20121128/19979_1 /TAXON_ID=81844 /ORGANISM="Mantoniella antarctica, Strain SL-175" /LENGTH=109 /DNA_ID=CAMNT_0023500337 /DNA_START=33 /DNA_END=358 /DNA_ORIENTATION=+